MYRVTIKITIQQQTSSSFPARNKQIQFDFATAFETSDSWKDLTNKGKLTVPKNLYYRDQNNKLQPLTGSNINLGGFNSAPLFLRGDKVTIEAGYRYLDKLRRPIKDTADIFHGYISKVNSRIPIELELEDNMWKLKQLAVPVHTFSAKDTLENILKFILAGTDYKVNALTRTTFGAFTIGHETAAQVLERLQKTFGFESYFRGNELRSGAIVYIEAEAKTHLFSFYGSDCNVVGDDELEYTRKDDVVLSAVAHNTVVESTGKTTKDGQVKTRKRRIEVLVTIQNDKKTVKEIKKGDKVPANLEGERRTFFFPGASSVEELGELAYNQLKLYYYTGLKGKFTTFGIPFVKQGDNVKIKDSYLPERNGTYKVKAVDYTGGTGGLRQVIHLDYKLNVS